MKLYTKTGDAGETGLFDGRRVRKDDPRVCAYGAIDELNSQIGVAICSIQARDERSWDVLAARLTQLQSELFSLGAELATPEGPKRDRVPAVKPEHVARLEGWIDEASASVEPLRAFVLPGGHPTAAQLHVCRTACRRAEREIVSLASNQTISGDLLIYVNRLSDLLFAWARWSNRLAGVPDVPWQAP
jgi:cob(I)alamin adenosyltransferase